MKLIEIILFVFGMAIIFFNKHHQSSKTDSFAQIF